MDKLSEKELAEIRYARADAVLVAAYDLRASIGWSREMQARSFENYKEALLRLIDCDILEEPNDAK